MNKNPQTQAECLQLYAELSPILKAPALVMLSDELAPVRESIVKAYNDDPKEWWVPYHFMWGMAVRNLLRKKGYGEDFFEVGNLDDIYISLVEEALKLPESKLEENSLGKVNVVEDGKITGSQG